MGTKNDMNRIGLFQEMDYISINDPYVPSTKFGFNESAGKGKQMMPGAIKQKVTGLQDGYFTKQFPRVFEKEAYTDPVSNRRKERLVEKKKNVSNKPFITFSGEKKPLGLGSNFGTFGGKVDYFSPKSKDKPPHVTEKANVKTNPAKKGTGYGYVSVGIDKYPEYKPDKYDSPQLAAKEAYEKNKKATISGPFKSGKFHPVYFEKNPYLTDKDGPINREVKRSKSDSELKPFKQTSPPKTMANPDGFINKYPTHLDDPYKTRILVPLEKKIVNNSGKLFTPQQRGKSKPQESILNYNILVKVNPKTYRQAAQNYSTYNFHSLSAH